MHFCRMVVGTRLVVSRLVLANLLPCLLPVTVVSGLAIEVRSRLRLVGCRT